VDYFVSVAVHFSLAIAGLGKYTSQGSAFLVMMILGGGHHFKTFRYKVLPISFCFMLWIFSFLWMESNRHMQKQGIGHDIEVGGAH
jgi:FHS family L-fucose permease-like MFS transporter